MTRGWPLLGSAIFLVLAPGSAAGLVPWWISGWELRPDLFPTARLAGAALLGLGLAALLESFARFALVGLGTPAPVLPTHGLVVTGLYRHVRNPMYLAVTALVVGQALIFGDARLLLYAACLWLVFHLFVLAYEEPTLRRSFPRDYAAFFRNVPRWLPRLRPWRGETNA